MKESLCHARMAWAKAEFPTALRHYVKLLADSTEEERYERYENEFCSLLQHAYRAGVYFNDKNNVICSVLYPKSAKVIANLAVLLLERDVHRAREMFKRAVEVGEGVEKIFALFNLRNSQTMVFSTWHMLMLNDKQRNEAFQNAFARNIRDGMKVIDIGAGTGFLSILASRYTKAPIIALEGCDAACTVAERIVEENNVPNIKMCATMSPMYHFHGEVDVVISETLDAAAFGEKILQIFLDAHRRFAHTRTLFFPSRVTIHVQLLQSQTFYDTQAYYHTCTSNCTCHPNLIHNRSFKIHNVSQFVEGGSHIDQLQHAPAFYTTLSLDTLPDAELLSDPIDLFTIDLASMEELELVEMGIFKRNFNIPLKKSGKVHGMLVSFTMEVAEGIELESVRPGGCWEHAVYPCWNPQHINQGESFLGHYKLTLDRLDLFQLQFTHNHANGGLDIAEESDQFCSWMCLESGLIETANNEALKEFLGENRLYSQLYADPGVDLFWPIAPDGVLYPDSIAKLKDAREKMRNGMNVRTEGKEDEGLLLSQHDIIRSLSCEGCLFRSQFINKASRPDGSSHLGVNLCEVMNEFTLIEYREIKNSFTQRSDIRPLSRPFTLLNIDIDKGEDVISQLSKPVVLETGQADGILYWWVVNGSFSTRKAGLPLAAILFPQRIEVTRAYTAPVMVHCVNSNLIVEIPTDPKPEGLERNDRMEE